MYKIPKKLLKLQFETGIMKEVTTSIPMANWWKLDKEIDFENVNELGQIIHRHLGSIAMSMTNWEGCGIAEELGLTEPDRIDIYQGRYATNPGMQRLVLRYYYSLSLITI